MIHTFSRRDRLLGTFQRESKGSFSVVYQAMSELAKEQSSQHLDAEEVVDRIRSIGKAGNSS